MKRRIIFGILAAIWLGVIFWNSAQDAVSSSDLSRDVLDWLDLPISHHLLRKMAHFACFALLGVLLCGATCTDRLPWTAVCLMVLMAACADETIQLFSVGRSSAVSDVWLDFGGGVTGLIGFAAVRYLYKRKNFH